MLHRQGTGRHTSDEISAFRREFWECDNDLLSALKASQKDKEPFWILAGEHPTEADCILFGFIVAAMLYTACASPS